MGFEGAEVDVAAVVDAVLVEAAAITKNVDSAAKVGVVCNSRCHLGACAEKGSLYPESESS